MEKKLKSDRMARMSRAHHLHVVVDEDKYFLLRARLTSERRSFSSWLDEKIICEIQPAQTN